MKNLSTNTTRLYYLDWLRVIAFSILLFEHCAELFVPWKFWVTNSESSNELGYFIRALKPWRMPLLFIVSGAAVYLACKRKNSLEIFKERTVRILLPLVAAMLLVIPPQIYFIKIQEGYQGGFWQFYLSVFNFRWFPKGNLHWLHLWYLAFIFGFTMLVLPFLPKMRSVRFDNAINRIDAALKNPIMLITFGVVISLPYYFINTYLTKGNLAQLAFYFPYFLFGLTVFLRNNIQQTLVKHAKSFLLMALVATGCLFALSFWAYEGQLLVKQAVNDQHKPFGIFFIQSLNTWLCVLAILGYAIRYMNFKTAGLTYANEAVYPFYILHQTVIVAIGYYIVQMNASISWKLFLVTLFSFTAIWAFYEYVVKRTAVTRLIFGLKMRGKTSTAHALPKAAPINLPPGQVELAADLPEVPLSEPVKKEEIKDI